MEDVLIFLEEAVFDDLQRNDDFGIAVGCDVDETQQGLKDDQFMLSVFDIVNEDVADGLQLLVLDQAGVYLFEKD